MKDSPLSWLWPILAGGLFSLIHAESPVTPGDWVADDLLDRPIYGTTSYHSAVQQANSFVASLNLTEKVSMVTGSIVGSGCTSLIKPIERVGFKGLCMLDGPTAVNRNDLVSVFPAGITVAATWDKDHFEDRGKAIAREFRGKGAQIALGPSIGPLGRHPLGGRNWESFSPDPYLSGSAVSFTIRGMQKQGVQTCTKHYIVNEQETQRNIRFYPNGTVVPGTSSNVDDRTLHELYLWPFADAIKAGTTSIMCAYNKINGTYACENPRVLNEILRKELGFEGYVMSDWFAIHSTAESINAGLDMDPPGFLEAEYVKTGESWFGANLTAAVRAGRVSQDRLDEMVRRVMIPYFYLGQDRDYPTIDPSMRPVQAALYEPDTRLPDVSARDVRGDHAKLIRKIAADGTVMLKNENNTLPLRIPKNIGVFGNDAADPTEGLALFDVMPEFGPDIGTLDIGGGSGTARHTNLVSPLDAIKQKARETGARVQYIVNNAILAANDFRSIYPTPEVCLVFLKTYAGESMDRASFENDYNSTLVVNNVAALCPNTIVITHSAGVNIMPWAHHPNVTAILAAHYPGEESGNSIVDILYGAVEPSGRLPYTIPKSAEDYHIPIVYPPNNETRFDGLQSDFTEGQFIDYRHFDKHGIEPLYEFGFGLGYAEFDIESVIIVEKLSAEPNTPFPNPNSPIGPGGNVDLWKALYYVTATVRNLSNVKGITVIQLYISLPKSSAGEETPVKVLRGYEKMWMEAGEKREIMFALNRRDLSYWDVAAQQWRLPMGEVGILLGLSSRDLRVQVGFGVLDEVVERGRDEL